MMYRLEMVLKTISFTYKNKNSEVINKYKTD